MASVRSNQGRQAVVSGGNIGAMTARPLDLSAIGR